MLKRYRLLIALIIYAICFAVLYPLYRFAFDDDGIGYLMVTKRLAQDDFFHAINGYWSPLHSWLIAPFYKAGINEFVAFRISNGLIGVCILVSVNRLSGKAGIQPALQSVILLTCIPVTLAYVFHDLAADILVCLLLLAYTDIIVAKDFFTNRKKIIACAIIGCLAYFAKTYAFYFFLVHFIIIQVSHYRKSSLPERKKLFTGNLITGIGLFLLLAIPWIITLYYKYQFITPGYSGKINHTWELFHPRAITPHLLGAPPAPLFCFWEDPYYTTMNVEPAPTLFSWDAVIRQFRVIIHNSRVALKCFYNISLFTFLIIPAGIWFRRKLNDPVINNMLLVSVLLPLGYLLVHIETRFIWTCTFLLLIIGVRLLSFLLQSGSLAKSVRVICFAAFFASFLVYPVLVLRATAGNGKELFTLAKELQEKNISGNYASDNSSYSEVQRLAYFTRSTFYSLSRLNYTNDELLAACRETGIRYYFYYYYSPADLQAFKNTSLYKQAVGEIITHRKGLLLLKLQ